MFCSYLLLRIACGIIFHVCYNECFVICVFSVDKVEIYATPIIHTTVICDTHFFFVVLPFCVESTFILASVQVITQVMHAGIIWDRWLSVEIISRCTKMVNCEGFLFN